MKNYDDAKKKTTKIFSGWQELSTQTGKFGTLNTKYKYLPIICIVFFIAISVFETKDH